MIPPHTVTLNQAISIMDNINTLEGDILDAHFEGNCDGTVSFIVNSKIIQFGPSKKEIRGF